MIKNSGQDTKPTSILGVGIGLRSCHYSYIETHHPEIPWFEALSDNYLNCSGPNFQHLLRIRNDYPVTLHGVGMSLGSTDPLNQDYLQKLKTLITHLSPPLVSDHLCWTSVGGQYLHELLPLPYTEETLQHLIKRIGAVQDFLGRRLMIENASSYLTFKHSEMTEWEFLSELAKASDCWILLDINNIHVSAENHGFNSHDYLAGIPVERVAQFHLAGYDDMGTHLFDTHGAPIVPAVWKLYEKALERFGPVPALIERDNDIPDFSILLKEADFAQKIMDGCHEPA